MLLTPTTLVAATIWFHSPSGNIECELAATYAYCQTFRPAAHARLSSGGRLVTCHGVACLGNGPESARTLAYGRSIAVGPFRCTSRVTGIRCIVRSIARGFAISRSGVRRF